MNANVIFKYDDALTSSLRVFHSPHFELFTNLAIKPDQVSIIKRLSSAYQEDLRQRQQFISDNQFAANLGDQGILPFLQVQLSDGEPCYVSNFEKLYSVHELIIRSGKVELPSTFPAFIFILLEVAKIIERIGAEAAGAELPDVFVELNPRAIFVNQSGRVMVSHISIQTPLSITASLFTQSEMGYVTYAAPEQCVRGREPNYKAMMYTFGMIMFELLTGRMLYSLTTTKNIAQVMRRKMRCLHPLISDVDPRLMHLDDVLASLLNPIPEQRLTDIQLVLEEIGAVSTCSMAGSSGELMTLISRLERAEAEKVTEIPDEELTRSTIVTDITELNAS